MKLNNILYYSGLNCVVFYVHYKCLSTCYSSPITNNMLIKYLFISYGFNIAVMIIIKPSLLRKISFTQLLIINSIFTLAALKLFY